MRVISGTLGGRKIESVAGTSTRPTTDRVREALFSRLESRFGLEAGHYLDLFAGTGALGLEALSRGASEVVFVDSSPEATAVIRRNLHSLDLDAEVLTEDYNRALGRFEKAGKRFDGVFLDPPYQTDLCRTALLSLVERGLLLPEAWVSLEVDRGFQASGLESAFELVHERVYGDTKLILLRADLRT